MAMFEHEADEMKPHLKFSFACRKLVRATSSMTGPRAQLMSVASFFIMFSRSSFSRWYVSSLRLQCRLTTCSVMSVSHHWQEIIMHMGHDSTLKFRLTTQNVMSVSHHWQETNMMCALFERKALSGYVPTFRGYAGMYSSLMGLKMSDPAAQSMQGCLYDPALGVEGMIDMRR